MESQSMLVFERKREKEGKKRMKRSQRAVLNKVFPSRSLPDPMK
jgi:hypothetical protein